MKRPNFPLFLALVALPLFACSSRVPFSTGPVTAFQSDQCTFWPDHAFDKDWSECCYRHDLFYWAGGSSSERVKVDQELKSCIKKHSGSFNAHLMFAGVRLGSLSPVKFKGKQWGNAWGDEIRQTPLKKKEVRQLERSLHQTLPDGMSSSDIDIFIEELEKRLQNNGPKNN